MAISRECGKCKGSGWVKKPYKDVWGGRHNEQKCPVCGGSGRNPDYRENRCQYKGGCSTYIPYHVKSSHPPTICQYHKEVLARERQDANAKRERENSERAARVRSNVTRRDYPGEKTSSENSRFYAACGDRGAGLTREERDRFSIYFHTLPDRERMSFDKIVELAKEWKRNNGGGFRRSDR